MKVRRSLLKDTVLVETRSGVNAFGKTTATSVAVRCNIDNKRRQVRNSDGVETVAEATLIVHPSDGSMFTPESRLTIDGRASTVITSKPLTLRGVTSHHEVTCT